MKTSIKRIKEYINSNPNNEAQILKSLCNFIQNYIVIHHNHGYISDEDCVKIFKFYIKARVESCKGAGETLKNSVSKEVKKIIRTYREKVIALADIKKFYSIRNVIKLVKKENIRIFTEIIRSNIKIFNTMSDQNEAYAYIVKLKEMLNEPLNNVINAMITMNFEVSYRSIIRAIEMIKMKAVDLSDDKKLME